MEQTTVKKSIGKLLTILKPHKKDIFTIYLVAIFNGLIVLSLPIGIQMVINLITTGLYTSSWYLMVGLVILGLIAGALLYIYLMFVVERLQQKIYLFTVFDLATLIPEWKIDKLISINNSEFLNRFFDVINIQKGISKILIDFISGFFMIVFGLILLSIYHSFFLGLSVFALIFLLVMLQITSKKGLDSSIMESKIKYKTAYWIEQMGNSIELFKQNTDSNLVLKRTDKLAEDYLKYRKKHFSVLITQFSWMSLFKIVFTASLLIAGGILVIEQQMNIGQFVAAEIIIIMVISSMEKLILSMEIFFDLLTSIEKVAEIYEIETEKSGTEKISTTNESGLELNVNNLSYNYFNSTINCIEKLNLEVKSGEKVAIISENEQFKYSLLNILVGFYDDFSGEVLVNQIPMKHLNCVSYRSVISESFINSNLFYGTIRQNLTFEKDISDEKLRSLLRQFHLEKLINNLPEGLETEVNSNDERIALSNQLKIKFIRSIQKMPKLYLTYNFWNNLPKEEGETFKNYLLNTKNLTVICAVNGEEDLTKYDKIYKF